MLIIPEDWKPRVESASAPARAAGAVQAPLNDFAPPRSRQTEEPLGPPGGWSKPHDFGLPPKSDKPVGGEGRQPRASFPGLEDIHSLDKLKAIGDRLGQLKVKQATEWNLLVALRVAIEGCKQSAAAAEAAHAELKAELVGLTQAIGGLRGVAEGYRTHPKAGAAAAKCLTGLDAFATEVAARGCTPWAVGAVVCGLKAAQELWHACGRKSELGMLLGPASDAWTRAAEMRRGLDRHIARYQVDRAEFTSAEIDVARAFKNLSREQGTPAAVENLAGVRRACVEIGRALIAGPMGLDGAVVDAVSKRLTIHAQALLNG